MIDDTEAMTIEQEEIMSGKYFQIEQATVEYNNGVMFTFVDYGKTCAILDKSEEEEELIIVKDKLAYLVSTENKTFLKLQESPHAHGRHRQ